MSQLFVDALAEVLGRHASSIWVRAALRGAGQELGIAPSEEFEQRTAVAFSEALLQQLRGVVDRPSLPTLRADVSQVLAMHFRVELPRGSTTAGKKPAALVIDDELNSRERAHGILRMVGYAPTSVSSGFEAIAEAAEQDFALVLLDLVMPDLDGFRTADELRAVDLRLGRERTRVFAVSARVDTKIVRQAAERGIETVIEKPLRLSTAQTLFPANAEAKLDN